MYIINHCSYLIDIDECEEYGICDQFCHNIYNKYPGQYECSCHEDYELLDNHKCKIKGNVFDC